MEKMRENEGKIDNGEHIVRNQYKLLFARRRLKGIKHVLPDDPDELRAYKQRIRENIRSEQRKAIRNMVWWFFNLLRVIGAVIITVAIIMLTGIPFYLFYPILMGALALIFGEKTIRWIKRGRKKIKVSENWLADGGDKK